jgi:hypothetical protein
MAMGDDCFIDRLPGVNIKPSGRTAESFVREFD